MLGLRLVAWHRVLLASSVFLASLVIAHAHEGATTIVDVRDDGFAPAQSTVLKGDTITFRIQGEEDHWPASNIHPTHGVYPEFDPQRPLISGQEWSFTFMKVGEWRFHDHLFPEHVGTIMVKEDPDFVQMESGGFWSMLFGLPLRIARIGSLQMARVYYWFAPGKLQALDIREVSKNEDDLRHWLKIFGSKKLMTHLLESTSNGSEFDCHQAAHRIGRVSFSLYGMTAFANGNANCHSGYYHGAMEGLLRESGTADLMKIIDDACEPFTTIFARFSCLHGIGHGALTYLNYDLPATLKLCSTLTDGQRQSCYDGAFMENIIQAKDLGAIPGHGTTWVSQDDPYFPCNAVAAAQDIQESCYLMQTSWMFELWNGNVSRVAAACKGAPKDMVPVCFNSIGRDIAGFALRDPEAIVEQCQDLPVLYHRDCFEGGLNAIVDFWGRDLADQGSALCALLPKEEKQHCYAVLSVRSLDVRADSSGRRAICSTFEPQYQYVCQFAIEQAEAAGH